MRVDPCESPVREFEDIVAHKRPELLHMLDDLPTWGPEEDGCVHVVQMVKADSPKQARQGLPAVKQKKKQQQQQQESADSTTSPVLPTAGTAPHTTATAAHTPSTTIRDRISGFYPTQSSQPTRPPPTHSHSSSLTPAMPADLKPSSSQSKGKTSKPRKQQREQQEQQQSRRSLALSPDLHLSSSEHAIKPHAHTAPPSAFRTLDNTEDHQQEQQQEQEQQRRFQMPASLTLDLMPNTHIPAPVFNPQTHNQHQQGVWQQDQLHDQQEQSPRRFKMPSPLNLDLDLSPSGKAVPNAHSPFYPQHYRQFVSNPPTPPKQPTPTDRPTKHPSPAKMLLSPHIEDSSTRSGPLFAFPSQHELEAQHPSPASHQHRQQTLTHPPLLCLHPNAHQQHTALAPVQEDDAFTQPQSRLNSSQVTGSSGDSSEALEQPSDDMASSENAFHALRLAAAARAQSLKAEQEAQQAEQLRQQQQQAQLSQRSSKNRRKDNDAPSAATSHLPPLLPNPPQPQIRHSAPQAEANLHAFFQKMALLPLPPPDEQQSMRASLNTRQRQRHHQHHLLNLDWSAAQPQTMHHSYYNSGGSSSDRVSMKKEHIPPQKTLAHTQQLQAGPRVNTAPRTTMRSRKSTKRVPNAAALHAHTVKVMTEAAAHAATTAARILAETG